MKFTPNRHPMAAVQYGPAPRPTTYSADECLVWKILFDRQTALLHRRAAPAFTDGLRALGLGREAPPDLLQLSKRLRELTGWELVPVSGRVPDETYLRLLGERQLPVTTWLRARRDTEFLSGPDLFHDVFGHLPLLVAEPEYRQFLEQVGALAKRQHVLGTRAAPLLTRLLWHTTEFGLVEAPDGLRALGAGLLSSTAELHFSLSPDARREPLTVAEVLATPVARGQMQARYFTINGYEQLLDILAEVAVRLGAAGPLTQLSAHAYATDGGPARLFRAPAVTTRSLAA